MNAYALPFLLAFLLLIQACSSDNAPNSNSMVEEIGISVPKSENRPFSYTNKKSAYWIGFTQEASHPEWSWFEGFTVATKKVFSGYEWYIGEERLDLTKASSMVYPHKMKRSYEEGISEELILFDELDALRIKLDEPKMLNMQLKRAPTLLKEINGVLLFQAEDSTAGFFGISSLNGKAGLSYKKGTVEPDAPINGLLFYHDSIKEKVFDGLERLLETHSNLESARSERMNTFLDEYLMIESDQDSLELALQWIGLTLDQLLTEQQGKGIYAGLPWFNDYWGRDLFISMPGATLVTGQFEDAKDILLSFSKLQDTNPESETYGRVPNRARPDDLIYNTTDGTPRFVLQAMEYVRYTGDTTIIESLYPAIKRSIEGNLARFIDNQGFLIHADADTWMDAKWEGKTPWSPRGNRANDIQALWMDQLNAGAWFAEAMGEQAQAEQWRSLASRVSNRFEDAYVIKGGGYLADHLNEDGSQDRQFRPNQLFALHHLSDKALIARITRMSWSRLTYPWGVSSLDAGDSNFHPYHLAAEFYHKDAAYHNGAIWLWLNGIMMQRMIEFGQQDTAFELFKMMNRLALEDQGVGSMAENADAIPREGAERGKTTGTFNQAWSSAEHLRVWYQHFLGFQPDMLHSKIQFEPHIPSEIRQLQTYFHHGKGKIDFSYVKGTEQSQYLLKNESDERLIIAANIPLFPNQDIELQANEQLKVVIKGEYAHWSKVYASGKEEKIASTPFEALKVVEQQEWDYLFQEVDFAKPKEGRRYRVLE